MLVSAKQLHITLPPKRVGDDPTTDAAAGLQGGAQGLLATALQNQIQSQSAQDSGQVQASEVAETTQAVNAAAKISDNIDEAFAKTRVQLSAAESASAKSAKGSAMSGADEFKAYMSKTPEERYRDSILKEMGLTEEEVEAMPPEQQQALAQEIAQRVEDKMKMAQAEKEQEQREKTGSQPVVDKLLASL